VGAECFDPAAGHVVAALIRKIEEAKRAGGTVCIRGTGTPSREFLFVDDAADAIVFLMRYHEGAEPPNIGSRDGITIPRLAKQIVEAAGFTGAFGYDTSKPDGMPHKRPDGSRILALGVAPGLPLLPRGCDGRLPRIARTRFDRSIIRPMALRGHGRLRHAGAAQPQSTQ
jgi:GDP-L-fucose synthase